MNNKAIKSTLFGILSVQSLFASTTQASTWPANHNTKSIDTAKIPQTFGAERIIQKRLVGFDPKQAIETLTYLKNSGVQRFENDGSLYVSFDMVQDLMETANTDGLEVRILNFKNETAKIKFAAYDPNKFDRSRIAEAKKLAQTFDMKCDIDGKSM